MGKPNQLSRNYHEFEAPFSSPANPIKLQDKIMRMNTESTKRYFESDKKQFMSRTVKSKTKNLTLEPHFSTDSENDEARFKIYKSFNERQERFKTEIDPRQAFRFEGQSSLEEENYYDEEDDSFESTDKSQIIIESPSQSLSVITEMDTGGSNTICKPLKSVVETEMMSIIRNKKKVTKAPCKPLRYHEKKYREAIARINEQRADKEEILEIERRLQEGRIMGIKFNHSLEEVVSNAPSFHMFIEFDKDC